MLPKYLLKKILGWVVNSFVKVEFQVDYYILAHNLQISTYQT